MQQTHQDDKQLIDNIKTGDEKSIVQVYQLYKDSFVNWAQATYRISEDAAVDAFQDAVVCLYKNIVKGKLDELTSSLKTYVYAIGKNIIRKKLRQPITLDHDDVWILENVIAEPIDHFAKNDRQRFVARLVSNIGEPCQTILRLFYFKNYSLEAIASAMNYKNENVVKTQKLRCLTTLKSMVRGKYSGEEF